MTCPVVCLVCKQVTHHELWMLEESADGRIGMRMHSKQDSVPTELSLRVLCP